MMFTKDQSQELIDNTTYEWVTINGVNGGKFINKTDTSKYIFLSAGGQWEATFPDSIDNTGYYWSITIYPYDNKSGQFIYVNSVITSHGSEYRWEGSSIRPIAPVRPW